MLGLDECRLVDAINIAAVLCDDGDEDGAMDVIYRAFDDCFLCGAFDNVDMIMSHLNPACVPAWVSFSILAITKAAAIHLPSRGEFYDRVMLEGRCSDLLDAIRRLK